MATHVSAIEYHERTKHSPESVRAGATGLDWENKPLPYKIYEDRPTIELPEKLTLPDDPTLSVLTADEVAPDDESRPTDSRRPDLPEPRRPDLGDLARLCHYAVGVTRVIERRGTEHHFRAAATTGALYHVDCYVVAGDLADLDAGVYHFDPRSHAFDVLREGDFRGVLVEASGREPAVADAPAVVVTTSTWWRNAWKYGDRTYRHAFWDSGTSLANLLAVARVLDLPAQIVTGFADGTVADLLGVDPAEEAPLELVPIGSGGAPAPDPPAVDRIDPTTRPLSDEVIEHPLIVNAYETSALADGSEVRAWRSRGGEESGSTSADATSADATSADATSTESLPDDPASTDSTPTEPASADPTTVSDGERIELDPVDRETASKRPLEATIGRRGSCRRYRRDSVSFRMLSTLLDRAIRPVPLDVGSPAEACPFTEPYLIVNDVEGLTPGSYRYDVGSTSLELLREGWFRREAAHLALDQRLAMDAAVCVFFMADLDTVVAKLGDRGYRVAQLEAAIAAGRLYLATYAHRDLGATGLTFYDDVVSSFFEPHAAGTTPLFCWTVGRPA